jgi:hypothetical protein
MGVGVSIGASPVGEPIAAARPAAEIAARAEARLESIRRMAESVLVPGGAIVAALVLFGVFMALTGRNPLAVYREMFRGSFGTWFSFQNTLQRAAPLMLTALATALPLRLGLVVLGGEGAMVLGGLAAAAVAVHTGSPLSAKIAMLAAGALVGGAWLAGAGALRAYRGVNETISTLLLNYIARARFAIRPASTNPRPCPSATTTCSGTCRASTSTGGSSGGSSPASPAGCSCSGPPSASRSGWWAATCGPLC